MNNSIEFKEDDIMLNEKDMRTLIDVAEIVSQAVAMARNDNIDNSIGIVEEAQKQFNEHFKIEPMEFCCGE